MAGKLNKEMLKTLTQACRLGMSNDKCAGYARLHPAILARWLEAGIKEWGEYEKGPKSIYMLLAEEFSTSQSNLAAEHLLRIRRAAEGGAVVERKTITVTNKDGTTTTTVTEKVARPEWTAGAWMLERKWPNEFGQKQRKDNVELEGVESVTIVYAKPDEPTEASRQANAEKLGIALVPPDVLAK